MGTYVILSRLSRKIFNDPNDFKKLMEDMLAEIQRTCPSVTLTNRYVTLGDFDMMDVIESNDSRQVEKAAMIIRAYGNSTTETLVATPSHEFLAKLN